MFYVVCGCHSLQQDSFYQISTAINVEIKQIQLGHHYFAICIQRQWVFVAWLCAKKYLYNEVMTKAEITQLIEAVIAKQIEFTGADLPKKMFIILDDLLHGFACVYKASNLWLAVWNHNVFCGPQVCHRASNAFVQASQLYLCFEIWWMTLTVAFSMICTSAHPLPIGNH